MNGPYTGCIPGIERDMSAAIWAASAAVTEPAYEGDVDALREGLKTCSAYGAGEALRNAAIHADPACVQAILAEFGDKFSVHFVHKAVEMAAVNGRAETLRALMPYWAVNSKARADRIRWTRDETCRAVLSGVQQEVAA